MSPESKTATPASATFRSASSRYLIHVVPPKHFPHESRKDPEAFAAFRRGSLVPLHATLQAQIAAIAREFQLPTTCGIVLYLVNEQEHGVSTRSALGKGPRISEEVWNWLWTKVAEERPVMRGVGLGLSSTASSPAPGERPMLLRKHSSPAKLDLSRPSGFDKYPLTPSPSTPSTSTSTTTPQTARQEESKDRDSSVGQSGSSQYFSTSSNLAPDTPPSSLDLDRGLLPGLGSPSLLPVLAKVEFDIDRKAGTWYETWCRSRKALQKRKDKSLDAQGKLQLRITINDKKGTISPPSSSSDEEEEVGYKRLGDSPDEIDPEDELTAGPSPRRVDPLADVFGSDGEAWSDMQSRRPARKTKGDLALDGASLSGPQVSENPERKEASDDEVFALWKAHDQPQLHVSGMQMQRGKVPPPLNLQGSGSNLEINIATVTPSPYSSSSFEDSSRLPYLTDRRDTRLFLDDETLREKRTGGIYDDVELDLVANLNIEEHRAKQLKIREELDVLERNLMQFSPRALNSINLSPDMLPPNSILLNSAPPQRTVFSSSHHGGSQSVQLSGLNPNRVSSVKGEGVIGPPLFKQPALVGTPSPEADSFKGTNHSERGSDGNVIYESSEHRAAWPSVSYATLANRGEGDPLLSPTGSLQSLKSARHPNSPPKVVLNGKMNGTTKTTSVYKRKNSSISSLLSTISGTRETSESKARMKQFEEEAGFYTDVPRLQPSLSRRTPELTESPVIPLSPDPFGRFPSSVDAMASPVNKPPERTSSLEKGSFTGRNTARDSMAPSSRFSVDSVAEEQQSSKVNKASNLVSMKSIRKLWRKNDKSNNSGASIPPSPDPSSMPSRPMSSATTGVDTETDTSRTPSPSIPFPSGPKRGAQKPRKSSRDSGLDPFYFDQELKYPTRQTPSPSAQMAYQFPPNSGTQAAVRSTTPISEKKRSVRKSLVSKWKNGSEGSSTDSGAETRRRRPSILDLAGLMRSGGGSISSTTALQSPVPEIPAEYRMSQHPRTQSRASIAPTVLSTTGDDRGYGRRKPTTQVSTDSSQESVDPIPTPVSAVPPLSFSKSKNKAGSLSGSLTLSLASAGEASDGMRSSFDDSQFEIVSPHVGRLSPAVSIGTTQNGLDRDE